jgi:hypothetical protein
MSARERCNQDTKNMYPAIAMCDLSQEEHVKELTFLAKNKAGGKHRRSLLELRCKIDRYEEEIRLLPEEVAVAVQSYESECASISKTISSVQNDIASQDFKQCTDTTVIAKQGILNCLRKLLVQKRYLLDLLNAALKSDGNSATFRLHRQQLALLYKANHLEVAADNLESDAKTSDGVEGVDPSSQECVIQEDQRSDLSCSEFGEFISLACSDDFEMNDDDDGNE